MAYELEEARAIDERMAPATPPVIAGVELAAARLVVRTVGGDYFDVIRFDDGTAALCIADVIGKGIPAAMLLANLQAAVRALASPGLPPAEMCRRLNRALCQNMPPGKFITLVYALLDPASGRLTYANAGHSLPALLRAGGGVEYLREGGTVLGVFRDWSYQQAELVLGAGDRLLLYTDGVTEARNAEGEEFGEERLLAAARASHHNAAEGVKNRIFAALEGFAGGFQDDATLLVVAR
jgi:sigma-B regulation protein RsbU (phosphoserine phosphatase)